MTTTTAGVAERPLAGVSEVLCEAAAQAIVQGEVTATEMFEIGALHPDYITMTTLAVACERFGLDAATLLA